MTELPVFQVLRNHIHPAWISDKYHIVRQFFRSEMQMEDRPIGIYYKF